MRWRHKCFASTHFIAIRAKQYPFFREMGLGLNLSPSDEGSDRPGSPNTRCPRPCLRPLFSARTNRRLILASCCCYCSGGCPTLLSDRVGRVTVARILDFGVISQRPRRRLFVGLSVRKGGWTILGIVLWFQKLGLERLDKASRCAVPIWHNGRGLQPSPSDIAPPFAVHPLPLRPSLNRSTRGAVAGAFKAGSALLYASLHRAEQAIPR